MLLFFLWKELLLIEAQDSSETSVGALWLRTSLRPCRGHGLVVSAHCRDDHVYSLWY